MFGSIGIGDGGISKGNAALGTSVNSSKMEKLFAPGFGAKGFNGEPGAFASGENSAKSAPMPADKQIQQPGLGGKTLSQFFDFKGSDKLVSDQVNSPIQ